MKKIWNVYKNLSLPLKSSIWFVFCNALQKCVAVITTPIFTRILNTNEYGVVSLYISWESIITLFATLYLTTGGGFYNGMKRYRNDRDGYTSSILCLVSIITFFWFIIYTSVRIAIGDFLGLPFSLMTMMFIDIFFTSAISLWSIRNRYEFKYQEIICYTIITTILMPIISIILIAIMPEKKPEARVLGMVLVKCIVYGYLYYKIMRKGKTLYNKEYWMFSVRFNIPLLPHYLSQMILEQSDRIMISDICGVVYAGIYSVAYNVSLMMKMFTTAINGTLTPWTYQCLEKKEYRKLNRVCLLIEIFIGVGCWIVCLFAPEIISILASGAYIKAYKVIPPVAISVLFMMLYSFFVNIEFYFEKNKAIMFASIVSAIMNVILNGIFIKKYGFVAAGYTTLICYFLYSVFHYYFMKKICKEENIPCVYKGWAFWICAIVFVALCLGCNMIYNYPRVRYLITLGLCMIVLGMGYNIIKNPEIIKKLKKL